MTRIKESNYIPSNQKSLAGHVAGLLKSLEFRFTPLNNILEITIQLYSVDNFIGSKMGSQILSLINRRQIMIVNYLKAEKSPTVEQFRIRCKYEDEKKRVCEKWVSVFIR